MNPEKENIFLPVAIVTIVVNMDIILMNAPSHCDAMVLTTNCPKAAMAVVRWVEPCAVTPTLPLLKTVPLQPSCLRVYDSKLERPKAFQAPSFCVYDVENNCVCETVICEYVLARVSASTVWSAPSITTLFATGPFPHSIDLFFEYSHAQVVVLSDSFMPAAVNTSNSVFVFKGSDGPERPQSPISAAVKVQGIGIPGMSQSVSSLTSRPV